MKTIFTYLFFYFLFIFNGLVQANDLPGFVAKNSGFLPIHSPSNKKDYELYIQLPKDYKATDKNSNRKYPLIIVNDYRFAFPIVSGAVNLMGGQDIQEAIVVGISYSKGDEPAISRTRDYTPTHAPNGNTARAVSGHAKEYTEFIANQVIPEMKKHYPVDDKNKVFVGHSYGGLLGCYILLNQPQIFDHYIIGSPSLWYDDNIMFQQEAIYAKTHKDLKANVAMYVGSEENMAMIDDLLAFEKTLGSRNYPHLKLHVEVLKNETHHSVLPGLISRGLIIAIPLKR